MKKLFCTILILLLLCTAIPLSSGALEVDGQVAAERLSALGLLAGVGTNADGAVNFDIDGSLNRAQSTTQVVRFLGAEKDALSSDNKHPFTDLAAWAVPYVSYAYANKIVNGVSANKFGSDSQMSDAAFLTLILRVLGYSDAEGDFAWNNPYALAKKVGIIENETPDSDFTRGDAFVICYKALNATVKSGNSIKDKLIAKGIFTDNDFAKVSGASDKKVLTIKDLNKSVETASHVNDDIKATSVEVNYRELVDLNSAKTTYTRYDNAFYPRIKQIRDDLFILFFMGGQTGPHLYWTLSSDGINWDAPEVLHNSNNADKNFVYTQGPLEGKKDRLIGCNADAIVLDNGEILCVYYERPSDGYDEYWQSYWDLNGIFIVRGRVDENDKIVWGEHKKIYTGSGWEPYIHRLADGTLQIFWSSNAEYHAIYGLDTDRRSTYVMMIESYDNGYTWTPSVKEGDTNNYVAIRVFKESIGTKIPNVKDKSYTQAVPYWAGQMPAVTTLYNGKSLMAVEARQADLSFDISFAISEDGGKWKALSFEEEGPSTIIKHPFDGAGPYLSAFVSGEIYLTYHWAGHLYYRMVNPTATEYTQRQLALPSKGGMWGSSLLVGSHEVISAYQVKYGDKWGIQLGHSYLNHRTNAKLMTPCIDGLVSDWANNTDALFVGSETQAQITTQTAHDTENIYFLINRLDNYITDGDSVTVNIGIGDMQYYRVTASIDGTLSITHVENGAQKQKLDGGKVAVKLYGTQNDNSDKDGGAVIEIAIPKSLLGLADRTSFKLCPALVNQDGVGTVSDTLSGVNAFITTLWPTVNLD